MYNTMTVVNTVLYNWLYFFLFQIYSKIEKIVHKVPICCMLHFPTIDILRYMVHSLQFMNKH